MKNMYKPEGSLIGTSENREFISSVQGLERAMQQGKILEATAILCDANMRLYVDLYGIIGYMEKEDVTYTSDGEVVKDIAIITRVGKPVCFKVVSIEYKDGTVRAKLSRRLAQIECFRNYLSDLICGDIVPVKVTHLENFGAFVDIGCGIISLLSIDCISISRISHPSDRLCIGQNIYAIIKSISNDSKRFFVSQKELLGTWEENAALFSPGQTVAGIIRSIENYGVFIELTANLAGLAEIRAGDFSPSKSSVGQCVAVYIKSIIPEKMKIKLVLVDSHCSEISPMPIKYFINPEKTLHLDRWKYSPDSSSKLVETVFNN